MAEFEMRWRHWQEQCQHRLEDGEFASDVHMETICRVGNSVIVTVTKSIRVLQ